MATAAWSVYARPIEGSRVERKGVLKVVAWRRVESTAIVGLYIWEGLNDSRLGSKLGWEISTKVDRGLLTLCSLTTCCVAARAYR